MRLNRCEYLYILLNSDLENAESFLERFVRQMSDNEFYKAIDYLEQVEYWRHRINRETGEIIDTRPEED